MTTIAKTSQVGNNLQTVDFNGQSLFTFEEKGNRYTAMKPICENIGLDWRSQRQRLLRDEVLSEGVVMITTPTKGGVQKMLCLPIQYLNGWLFGVDAKRVKPEIKDRLLDYKRECYQVLHNYWNGKTAESHNKLSTVADRKPLVAAVNTFCAKTGAFYGDVWKMMHQRFGLANVNEMTVEQVPQAIDYVHGLLMQVQYGGLNIDVAMDNEMWRYVGILKYHELSKTLNEAKKAVNVLYSAIGSAQSHGNLVYDAFGEQRRLTTLGEGGSQAALEQAKAFIERQDARNQIWGGR